MFENLYFAMRKLSAGMMLILIALNGLYAQGNPQNCTNADPGNNPGDVGCVKFTYQGQTVSYTTVRANDGKIWLQQNLGSSKVASSLDDEASYGDLFQWGRWDDGHQLRNSATVSAPTPNRPDGLAGVSSYIIGTPAWWSTLEANDEWTAKNIDGLGKTVGVDPCKAIGADWRMPTQADWASIVSLESVTAPASAYSSHLKLPAGGYRSSSDAGFTFVGKRGYFWSSDVSGLGGKYLYVGTISANASAGAPRGQGASVRCIKPTSALATSEVRLNHNSIGMYPNPTKGILTIKADSSIESIMITNTVGQKMDAGFSNDQVNMTGLPDGLYIVEIKLKNGQTVSKKIIKG
ncbi:T9SS type A sorting domain-containing protein [Chryseobacterium rhizosphaerae]|uniref:T9SS type A sorting domain-containing protein n=1 Tax=Chryseobacterium rhizosphaerae TaxID=395937 RepID=UPI002358163E|nr:T9SS type A sorting domain-containing protein [Chryseobacterium rhizosphaerae]MDC8102748.1 T9SS type A sorting domain-containing protein [Chryseobacterium rhizosphaerae]